VSGSDFVIPAGFVWSATKAGLKASGGLDLAVAEAPLGASAAAMFTRNRVVAAPVTVGKENLKRTHGRVRAVVVNAGNANCATGQAGYEAARAVCSAAGQELEAASAFIIPCSTGIIGVPLPVAKLTDALPELLRGRGSDKAAVESFARAIMTTDTRPKVASAQFACGGKKINVLGVAKGSGMIHPNLATMLVYLFTDVDAMPEQLKAILRECCDSSFNSITVDGDTSTNDTVLLLASGASGCQLSCRGVAKPFFSAVQQVCSSLAEQIVTDGEGVCHVVTLTVEGARTRADADKIARTIAHSLLVKTAWAGADPNWGRILASVGRSGVAVKASDIDIFIGNQQVCSGGCACPFDEATAHACMKQQKHAVRVRVGRGKTKVSILTCDLTAEYVRINADYST
jgi:glutamate N-acetyltransferase/amino-acid N-acetyltransferase